MNDIEKERTEAEAVELLESDHCPVCTKPADCWGGQGSPDADVWFFECPHCGLESALHYFSDGTKRVSVNWPFDGEENEDTRNDQTFN